MHRSDDIANLFGRFGESAGDYQEIEPFYDYNEELMAPAHAPSEVASTQQQQPAPAEQPAPAAPSQPAEPVLAEPMAKPLSRLLQELEQQRQTPVDAGHAGQTPAVAPPAKTKVIAVVSAQGGVGKSTLAGALGNSLKRAGGRTLALDLSPQNALCLHLGGDPQWPGIAQAAGGQGRELLREGHAGGYCLPYGTASEAQRVEFERQLAANPLWLGQYLAGLGLQANDTVIIDTPPGATVYLAQALAVADVVLVVTLPDAASYAALGQMQRLLAPCLQRPAPAQCALVINQLDTSRQFSLDMCAVLKQNTGIPLLGVIHQDHFISESLAYDRNPLAHTPRTRGCQDALELINSLCELLTQGTLEHQMS